MICNIFSPLKFSLDSTFKTFLFSYFSTSLSPHGNLSLLNEMEVSDSEKSLNGSRR